MIVVGLNTYHGDASAALLIDGHVVAAVEEERFTRVKHWAGFPCMAIQSCLDIAGISARQVDHWVVNSDNSAHRFEKLRYLLSGGGSANLVFNRLRHRGKRNSAIHEISRHFDVELTNASFHRVEHHLCHLASAFFPSRFDQAMVLSIDGFGDFSSAAWGIGSDQEITPKGYVHFPHSLGIFYQGMTQYLGFLNYGDEYKVMGLASFGEASFYDQLQQVVTPMPGPGYKLGLKYFRHHKESIAFSWDQGAPVFDLLYSDELELLLGPARRADQPIEQRHRDIAAGVQRVYENCLFQLLTELYEKFRSPNLALAGGCAMNSVANGKISQSTPFKNVYIQPAAGDAGGAIGAGLIATRKLLGPIPSDPMPTAYLGPSYSDSLIAGLLKARTAELKQLDCVVSNGETAEVIDATVTAIIAGKVIGWFQGRMELGARALGNRSIICDPRRSDIQSLLNSKIKRRESFRPFAPSILREHVGDWFEFDGEEPYMQKVFPIRAEMQKRIPAVTHVDGSGRLQTVTRSQNSLYYQLIECFYARTGVPILLNTSFNENEPIVCRPEEALDCFLRTRMDLLVMGKYMISREDIPNEQPANV